MTKKIMAMIATGACVLCFGVETALAEKYKGHCLYQLGGTEDFDKCFVDVSDQAIKVQFRDQAKDSANQTVTLGTIDTMTVQRAKRVTADRVLFSPVWKWKARFSLFKIRYIAPSATGAGTQTLSFRVKEKQGIPLIAELERLTGKNVEIIEPEVEASDQENATDDTQSEKN